MDFEVLAIDPGGTTGLCLGVKEGKKLTVSPMQDRYTPFTFRLMLENYNHYVVCESFEYRKASRAGLDLTPVHLIGVAMAWVPSDKLRFQTAAQGKGFFSNEKLKQLDIYIAGKPHAMDAARHLLHWYKFGFGSQFYEEDAVIRLNSY